MMRMDEKELYDKLIKPRTKYFLIVEYAATFIGFFLGAYTFTNDLAFAFINGTSITIFDIIITLATKRSCGGIYIGSGERPPLSRYWIRHTVGYALAIVFIVLGVYGTLKGGDLRLPAISLCMGAMITLNAATSFLKKYERIIRFIWAVLLLPIPFIGASYASSIYVSGIVYAIGLCWGFFVALFAYGLIFKKGVRPNVKTGNI